MIASRIIAPLLITFLISILALSINAAQIYLPSSPGQPKAVTQTSSSLTITWTAPTYNGGQSTLSYILYRREGVGSSYTSGVLLDASAGTSTTITGLFRDTKYFFRVQAKTSAGTGPKSTESAPISTSATFPSKPLKPTVSSLSWIDDTVGEGITVSWSPPSDLGGSSATLTGYILYKKVGGADWDSGTQFDSSRTSAVLNNFVRNTIYLFRVIAVNVVGNSSSSDSSDAFQISQLMRPSQITTSPTISSISDKSVVVSWTSTINNGGDAITKFDIQTIQGSTTSVTSILDPTATSATISGLVAATSYTFKVRSYNSVGYSLYSVPSQLLTTLKTLPGAVAKPTVSDVRVGYATVNWSLPYAGGDSIVGFKVGVIENGASSDTEQCVTVNPDVMSRQVVGLYRATSYVFRVSARNSLGYGPPSPWSDAITTLSTRPFLCMNVTKNGNDDLPYQLSLKWGAPTDDGGSSITGYKLYKKIKGGSYDNGILLNGIAVTYVYQALIRDTTYIFQVTAFNSNGESERNYDSVDISTYSLAVPGLAPPGAPVFVSSTYSSLYISWTAPSDNGGSPITSYTIFTKTVGGLYNSGTVTSSAALNFNIINLEPYSQYIVKVAATNLIGTGSPSLDSDPMTTLATYPSEPGIPSLVLRDIWQLTISFSAPSKNGGKPITKYKVAYKVGVSGVYNAEVEFLSAATQVIVPSLSRNTEYFFKVRAGTDFGYGAYSLESVGMTTFDVGVPQVVPGAPILCSGSNLDQPQPITATGIQLCWSRPVDNGGLTIIGYKLYTSENGGVYDSGVDFTPTNTRLIANLNRLSKYRFKVQAKNTQGYSDLSGESNELRTTADRYLVSDSISNKVYAIDLNTGKSLGVLLDISAVSGSHNNIFSITGGKDDNLYVLVGSTSSILQFNRRTGAFIKVFAVMTFSPRCLAYYGNFFYVCSSLSRSIIKINADTGAVVGTFISSIQNPRSISFDLNGHLIVSLLGVGVVKYNKDSGAVIWSSAIYSLSQASTVAVSVDGQYVFVAGLFMRRVIYILNAADGTSNGGVIVDNDLSTGLAGIVARSGVIVGVSGGDVRLYDYKLTQNYMGTVASIPENLFTTIYIDV